MADRIETKIEARIMSITCRHGSDVAEGRPPCDRCVDYREGRADERSLIIEAIKSLGVRRRDGWCFSALCIGTKHWPSCLAVRNYLSPRIGEQAK